MNTHQRTLLYSTLACSTLLGLIIAPTLRAQAPVPAAAPVQGAAVVAPGAAATLPADPAAAAGARGGAGAGARGGAGGAGGFGGGAGGRGGRGGNDAGDADFGPREPILAKTPAEQLKGFVMPPGYRMELVASDPAIQQPTFIEFDGNGRMYVGEMRSYMLDDLGTKEYEPLNRISLFESTKGDGVFDKHTVFIDNITAPRAVVPLDKGRVLVNVTHDDNLYLYTDTDNDGVADKKEIFYTGVGLNRDGNIEHEQSGFVWAMDNWIYSTYNTFRFRWTPTGILKENIPNSGGQWGLTQDDNGTTWNIDAGGEQGPVNFQIPIQYGTFNAPDGMEDNYQVVFPISGLYDMQGGMNRIRVPLGVLNHFTAATGPDIFRGTALPDDLRGDLIFAEPVGRLVRRTKIVKTEGSTQLKNAYPFSEFIMNTDPLFRPINTKTAPDGSLYIVDMYHGIIQDTQWSAPGTWMNPRVKQLQLDKIVGLGRIWRVRYDGIPAHESAPVIAGKPAKSLNLTQPRMLDETPAQLVAHLTDPNGWWRDSAQRLLILKQDKSVAPALEAMVKSSDYLVARFHALWTLEGLNAMPASLVREAMKDSAPRLRVQAIRASETLYKAGDRSFEADYRATAKDSDPDVAIQALLTANILKLPDVTTLAKAVVAENKAKGMQEVGTWIANGSVSGGRGGAGRGGAVALAPELQALMDNGAATFTSLCFSCHGTDGRGLQIPDGAPGATMAPPLAGSPRVQGHRDYVIKALLNGVTGPIDGKTYTQVMIPMNGFTDEALAGIASYVRNSFGNGAGYITAADVARVRAANTRTTPWTVSDLVATLPTQLLQEASWKVSASATGTANTANVQNAFNLNGWALPAAVAATAGTAAAAPAAAPEADGWFQVELPTAINLAEITFNAGRAGARGGAGGAGAGGGRAGGAAGGPAGGPAGAPPAAGAPAAPQAQAAVLPPGTPAPAANPAVGGQAGGPGGGARAGRGQGGPGGAAPAAAVPAVPRQFGVQVSQNGTAWTTLPVQSRADGTLTIISFKPVQAKFVRITSPVAAPANGAPAPAAWSMTNLRLYQAGK